MSYTDNHKVRQGQQLQHIKFSKFGAMNSPSLKLTLFFPKQNKNTFHPPVLYIT